jgi:hypothetical protein
MLCQQAHTCFVLPSAAAAAAAAAHLLQNRLPPMGLHLHKAYTTCVQGRDSSDSGAASKRHAASQQLQAEQQQHQHEQPEIASALELTDEQTKAILWVSWPCSAAGNPDGNSMAQYTRR